MGDAERLDRSALVSLHDAPLDERIAILNCGAALTALSVACRWDGERELHNDTLVPVDGWG